MFLIIDSLISSFFSNVEPRKLSVELISMFLIEIGERNVQSVNSIALADQFAM